MRSARVALAAGVLLVSACSALVGVGDVTFVEADAGDDGSGPAPEAAPPAPDGGHAEAGTPGDAEMPIDSATPEATPGDASLESGSDGAPPLTTPRPIAPLSSSRATNSKPTFRWALPSGVTEVTLDLCQDRGCSSVQSASVVGTAYTPTSALPTGTTYWRLHPNTSTTLTSPTWQVTIPKATNGVNSSWGTTFDPDGDGYADVVVGSPVAEQVFVYRGSSSGTAKSPSVTLTAPTGGTGFGSSVASAGDVNGDGYADLVVGAAGSSGVAFVYLGGPSGIATTPSTTLGGPQGANGLYGGPVASAGDVNGDGYADVVIGNPALATNTGSAFVYLGGPSGLSTTAAMTMVGPAGQGKNFAGSVASAGDVNGDGLGDIVVGAHSGNTVYIYYGTSSGPPMTPDVTLLAPVSESDFGISVANAGDVNGDGYADLLVGAEQLVSSNGAVGAAYVFPGGMNGVGSTLAWSGFGSNDKDQYGYAVASAGDVNGDGYEDVVVGAYGTSSYQGAATIYFGSATNGLTGGAAVDCGQGAGDECGFSVAGAGDVNGDTYADVVVGAFGGFDAATSYAGAAAVFEGAATGIHTAPSFAIPSPGDGGARFGYSVFGSAE
jgi:FG-GAP-like repeat/FG-GAP repeat